MLFRLIQVPMNRSKGVLYRALVLLAGLLTLNCGDHEAFLIVKLAEIPPTTDQLTTYFKIGNLSTEDTWTGRPQEIGIFLPAGTVYWDPQTKALVGVAISVQVDAWDLSCIVATATKQMTAAYQARQEMNLVLFPRSGCPPTRSM